MDPKSNMERERKRARLVFNAAKASANAAQAELTLFEFEANFAMNATDLGIDGVAVIPENLSSARNVTDSEQDISTKVSAGPNSKPPQVIDSSIDEDLDSIRQDEQPAQSLTLPGIFKQHNHREKMWTASDAEADITASEKTVIVDLNEYATMTEMDTDRNPQVQQPFVSHSSHVPLKEGLLEEVNADTSMPDSKKRKYNADEYNAGDSNGKCRAGNPKGNSNGMYSVE